MEFKRSQEEVKNLFENKKNKDKKRNLNSSESVKIYQTFTFTNHQSLNETEV